MRLSYVVLFLLAAIRWGDLRNWRKYYPTVLFMIIFNLLYQVLGSQHPLWLFEKSWPFPNHTISSLVVTFTVFPATVLLYLSHFPATRLFKAVSYILLWNVVYLLYLHDRKPLWAWGLSAVVFGLMWWWFDFSNAELI